VDIRKKMCYAPGCLQCIENNELLFISFLSNPVWCVFKSGLAMCGWSGHALLHAEYRIATEVCMLPAFVGD
jgi:hypothetical protein